MSVLSYQTVSCDGGLFGVDAFDSIAYKRGPREPDTIPYAQWEREEARRAGTRRQTARPAPLGSRNTDAMRRRRMAQLLNEQKRDVLRRAETRRRNFGRPTPGHVVSGLAPYKQRLERIGGQR